MQCPIPSGRPFLFSGAIQALCPIFVPVFVVVTFEYTWYDLRTG